MTDFKMPPLSGDVIGDFLDKQSPPYDDEVVSEAYALGSLHTVHTIRYAFQEGTEKGDTRPFTYEEIMEIFDGMDDHVREVCARDGVHIDRYLGAQA